MSSVIRTMFGMGLCPMFGVRVTNGAGPGIMVHVARCDCCGGPSMSFMSGRRVTVVTEQTDPAAGARVAEIPIG